MKQIILTALTMFLIATVGCSGSTESGSKSSANKAGSGDSAATADAAAAKAAAAAAKAAAAATVTAYKEMPPVIADGTPDVGKEIPDIEGVDTDGTQFKLSDYRGKVVMIDFWGDW